MDTNWTKGQLRAKSKLLSNLGSNSVIAVLHGAQGVGKSAVVSAVREDLEKKGGTKVFSARCTEWSRHQNYRALEVGLTNAIAKFAKPKLGALATNAAKDIPFVGHSTSAALAVLLANSDHKSGSESRIALPQKLEELLAILNRETGKGNAVVVFEEAQWLDKETLTLITMAKSDRLSQDFPCLQRTKFILSSTHEFLDIPFEQFCADIEVDKGDTIRVDSLEKAEFDRIWSEIAPNVFLPEDISDKVFSVSNGSVNLVRHVAKYLAALPDGSQQGVDLAQDLIETAINFQFGETGESGSRLGCLLEKAALIGFDFSIAELVCLSGSKIDDVKSGLAMAEEQNVLQGSGGVFRFTDALLHSIFERRAGLEGKQNHRKFAECIRAIRPHEYEVRGVHALKSGQIDDGAELLALAVLRSLRLGEPINLELDAAIRSSCPDIVPFYDCLCAAFNSYNRGDFDDAVRTCEQVTICSYERLSAEANLLLARVGATTIGHLDRSEIEKRLKLALSFIDKEEIDLLFRARAIEIVYCAYEDRIDEARMLAGQLSKLLRGRCSFDPQSNFLLQVLRCNSDMYYADEIARSELSLAAQNLVPDGVSSVTSPTAAYVALTNLVGNALQCGRVEEAQQKAKIADEVVGAHPGVKFPRLDMLVSNQLVSEWFCRPGDQKSILAQYEHLVDRYSNSGDIWILQSNLSAMYLSYSMLDKAALVLENDGSKRLAAEEDAYFTYFFGNNLAALQFDRGDIAQAKTTFLSLAHLPLKLPYSVRQFLTLRHEVITHALECKEDPCVCWDDLPKEELEGKLGLTFRFFGRGLLFSDLQFWGEL